METEWFFEHGDISDFSADGLICSGNGSLNLSGGVGGAFAMKFGNQMQDWLHQFLKNRGSRVLKSGEVVYSEPFGWPFRRVAHCVAVDAFYETSRSILFDLYQKTILSFDLLGFRTVIAACMGCGYGRFPTDGFAKVFQDVSQLQLSSIEKVTFVTRDKELVEVIQASKENGYPNFEK